MAILSELVSSSEVAEIARASGNLTIQPSEAGMRAIFSGDPSLPLLCALDIWEQVRTLPAMSVRIALDSGSLESSLSAGPAGQITVSKTFADLLRNAGSEIDTSETGQPRRLVFLQTDAPADSVANELESALTRDGYDTSRDLNVAFGATWVEAMESRIRSADAAVVFVSEGDVQSELLRHQLEIAADERRKRGRPQVIPIWLTTPPSDEGVLSGLTRNLWQAAWSGREDTERVVEEVRAALSGGQTEVETQWLDLDDAGTDSNYIQRTADRTLESALGDHESIVLVKGPRQIGKTSLMSRGVDFVRSKGWRCVTTDFQKLSSGQFESEADFYSVVAATLARQAGFVYDFEAEWLDGFTQTLNMDEFMRALIADSDRPIVWFMDEADRLFTAPFCSEFFGLIRSWHNARATQPNGPWSRLTIVIGYATEAYLFIKDLNQSPFNVGVPIELSMFSLSETRDLNERYGRPLSDPEQVTKLYGLIGGQPFLTRRTLDLVTSGAMSVEELLAKADSDDGPFGDHLKRVLFSVTQLPEVWEALVQSLRSPNLGDSDGLHRLMSAGILTRNGQGFQLQCELYRRYLARHARAGGPT